MSSKKGKRKKSIYEPNYEQIISKLKEARTNAGIKQEYVAEKLGKYQSYVSKIEHGDRRVDIIELLELAELYGKDINFFIEDVVKKMKKKDKA